MTDEQPQTAQIPATKAVERLIEHFEEQARRRQALKDAGRKWDPEDSLKKERDKLMREMLGALGITREEFLRYMPIVRHTWDRWRDLITTPGPNQLEKLRQLALGIPADGTPSQASLKPIRLLPGKMLDQNPEHCTWGRLRLTYSFFRWDNAVLYYPPRPFADAATVTEMALLTLRDAESHGSCLVYILQEDQFESWREEYVKSLVDVFERKDAARAASGVCAILVPASDLQDQDAVKYSKGLGIFNYEHADPDETVGYEWRYTPNLENGEPIRPADDTPGVYWRFAPDHDPYDYIRNRFHESIQRALNEVSRRRLLLPRFWQPYIEPATIDELLQIPGVPWKLAPNGGEA